ncbi:MAG: MATE family efflux transporter [Eubacteriales bacterium]|nr:MATE family efflux transporter [Eubacteriales bacterium]
MSHTTSSMTEGSIWKKITFFALPLFMSSLFQQLYNVADSLIVGNFLGSDALAAVSSSGSVIFLMIGFFNGLSAGAGVVIARYYGSKSKENLQQAIHSTLALGIVCALFLTVIGLLLTPQILVWMDTPEDILSSSIVYLRIYFLGSLGFVLYNNCVSIFQAVGDSYHPLIYLIVSSVTNIALDILFIAVLKLGVGSAACATIISEFISAFLCLHKLSRSPEEYRISLKKIRFHGSVLKLIVSNGLPAAFQNSIISFANVIVQSTINSFGKMAVAGCGSYSKIEGFGFLPITCFSLALTTFISQNLGAKKYDRVKKGAMFAIPCAVLLAEFVGICIYILSPVLISAFNSDPAVVAYGVAQARTVTLFYFLLSFSHCIGGILRGAGRSTVPMLVMMICWCVIRVTYIVVAVRLRPVIDTVFWAYPLTWGLSSLVFLIYFLKVDWMHGKEF